MGCVVFFNIPLYIVSTMRKLSVLPTSSCVLLSLGLVFSVSYSQFLPYTRYTAKEGLISDWVITIAQDSRGYLWIGTSEGLSRFDGISFVNFTTKDGLADNFVECVVEDKFHPGTMLVGTRNGLARLNNRTMRARKILFPFDPLGVSDILCDRQGTTWLATTDGLYILDDSSAHKFRQVGNIDKTDIIDLEESGDGTLFMTVNPDLLLLQPNRASVHRLPLDLRPGTRSTCCRLDKDGSMWVGTSDSLVFHVRNSAIVGRFRIKENWVPDLADGGDGILWATTVNGLLRIPKKSPEQYSLAFPHRADHLLSDREGNLWGATREGIYVLPSTHLVAFPDTLRWDIGITQPARLVDSRHHVWSITNGGFFEYWQDKPGNWQRVFHSIKEVPKPQWATIGLHDRLWVSTLDTSLLFCYDIVGSRRAPSELQPVQRCKIRKPPHYFFTRGENEIWCASPDTPTVVRLDGRNGKIISQFNPPLAGFGPRCSFIDENNVFWIGEFDDGLFYTKIDSPNSWRTLTVANGLPDKCIRSLCMDKEGSLWIGTRYGGAAVFRNNNVESFDIKDGLPSNWIHCITQDSSGRIWFCTSLGLAYLENSSTREFRSIPELLGQRVEGIGEIDKNVFWVRNKTGIFFYDMNTEDLRDIRPAVNISDMEMNGKAIEPDSMMEFPHDQNLFSVNYAGIYFRDLHRLQYAYRLEGVDEAWQGPTDMRSITYSSLKPGKYIFSVKAISGNRIESIPPATARFSIASAYWERWWFRGIVGLVLLSIGPLVYYRRVRTFQREKGLQEQFSRQLIESQENERKRIAASLHDSLGQNLILSKNHVMIGLKSSRDPASIEQLNEISSLLSQSLDEVREIAYNLRPYHLDRIGLTRTLEFVVGKVKSSMSIECRMEIENIDRLLSPEGELSLYRVIQESLNNIIKHSAATTMQFKLQRSDHQIRCEIHDNGRGFDASTASHSSHDKGGFGLKGIAERVHLLKGIVSVHSMPGKGTTVTVTIPFDGNV